MLHGTAWDMPFVELKRMKKQSGFTLVEIAIVLVIIGLLLGGVLKGQELINSAKVKNFATDFRNIPLFIYGYQDKFRALPGDDSRADTNVASSVGDGDGVIEGAWNSAATTESTLFWQHVRAANLAAGATNAALKIGDAVPAGFLPTNADGGPIGIQSFGGTAALPIAGLKGTYIVCSQAILGKFVKQLDTALDNGDTASGSMMAATVANVALVNGTAAVATNAIDDATSYTTCLAF